MLSGNIRDMTGLPMFPAVVRKTVAAAKVCEARNTGNMRNTEN
jgi:hypothetical protein